MDTQFIKELKKINPFIDTLEDSKFGSIEEYISTGSLVLNALVSGDLYKGIPAGRITSLAGRSGVGKSYIAASICRNAQKQGHVVIWFDTENATDKDFADRMGLDSENMIYIPSVAVKDLEEFRNVAWKIMTIAEDKFKDKKIVMILDSLGNLGSSKEHADAEKDKKASDMGQRSKVIRSIFRVLTPQMVAQKITFISVNHTYKDPMNPYAGETESGGEGAIYNPTVACQFTKTRVKDNDKKTTGVVLKPLTTKNRITPPGKTGTILLDFTKGLDKYYGLLPIAEAAGLIIKDKTRYYVHNDPKQKKWWEKNLYCDEVFEPLLDDINNYLKENNTYSVIEEQDKDIIDEIRNDDDQYNGVNDGIGDSQGDTE